MPGIGKHETIFFDGVMYVRKPKRAKRSQHYRRWPLAKYKGKPWSLHTAIWEKETRTKVRPGETVHHIDCNEGHNGMHNFMLLKADDHNRLHKWLRMKAKIHETQTAWNFVELEARVLAYNEANDYETKCREILDGITDVGTGNDRLGYVGGKLCYI